MAGSGRAWVLGLMLVVGCQSAFDLRPTEANRTLGRSVLVRATPAEALATARSVAADLGLAVQEAGEGWFVAARPATAFSWGELIGVYTEGEGATTRVRVIFRRVLASNITATDFTGPMLEGLRAQLPSGEPNPWIRDPARHNAWGP